MRLSKDGVPIVVHDATLERLAAFEKSVSDLTAAQLQSLDVGSWFNRKFPNRANEEFSTETVPTLAQTIDFLRDFDGLIYIELKGKIAQMPALAEAVCALIRPNDVLRKVVVKSFKLDALKMVKKILPDVRCAALFSPKVLSVFLNRKQIIAQAEKCGANEISVHYSLATRKLIERAHKKSLSIVVWTIDNPLWIRRAIKLEFDAIITNNPARLIKKRNKICER